MNICIIGGTGFVGTHLINKLVMLGHSVKVITRHPERHRHLLTLPSVKLISIDFFGNKILERQLDGYDVVINLAGILNPQGVNTFEKAHVEVTRRVAEAARSVETPRLLHMSALNADENGPSEYLRTKGKAQKLVLATEGLQATSFAPSVILGPGDSFFNMFASLLSLLPVFPLTSAATRFAPVYVGDVVDAFINSIHKPETYGKNYELCGPEVYTLKELVQYTAKQTGSKSIIVPLNRFFSSPLVTIMNLIPGSPITRDNFNSMKQDSICQDNQAVEVLDLSLHSLDSVVPLYLAGGDFAGQMDELRRKAGR